MWFYRANTYCIVLHVIYTLFPLVILIAMRSATQLQATPTKISVKFAYPSGYDVRDCTISSKNNIAPEWIPHLDYCSPLKHDLRLQT